MFFGKKRKSNKNVFFNVNQTNSFYYDNIDFANIDSVTIVNTEMTYRTETEEEFDPVMTNFLTDMDGWQHYETKTVEYEVENGHNITFLICFTNGTNTKRTYHESHHLAQRLLEISQNSSILNEVIDCLHNISKILAGDSYE